MPLLESSAVWAASLDESVVVVQARMASRRLPGKVLLPIAGEPMVIHVLRRAGAIGAPVLLAASRDPGDDPLVEVVRRSGWSVVRGDPDDLLDRFVTATPPGARHVVRVTADCPLFDPAIGRAVLAALRAGSADYVSNTIVPTFPDGLDCEAFTADALRRAWREARSPSEREHATPYIRDHPELFRQWNLAHVPDLSHERWTVDDARDLAFVRAVYERLDTDHERQTSMYAVLAVLAREPSLRELNAGTARNEGYRLSRERERERNSD